MTKIHHSLGYPQHKAMRRSVLGHLHFKPLLERCIYKSAAAISKDYSHNCIRWVLLRLDTNAWNAGYALIAPSNNMYSYVTSVSLAAPIALVMSSVYN